MAYGELKVDSITFTDGGSDVTVSVSGLTKNPTFSGDIVVNGNISGTTITGDSAGFGSVTGVTVTGTTANFVSGVFTTQVSGTAITGNTAGFTTVTGTTVTGTTANFVTVSGTTVTGGTGNFTSVSATTATITSGVFASGTAAAPSVSVGTTDNGLYSPGTDQVALSISGAEALRIDSGGNILVVDGNNLQIDEVRARDGDGLKLFDDGGAGIFVQDGGNVGIGTSSPASLLNVKAANTSYTGGITITASNGATTSAITQAAGKFFISSNSSSDHLVIDSSGRVGIGTTSPGTLLELAGVSNPQITLNGSAASGRRGLIFEYNGTQSGEIGQNIQTGELRIRSGETGQNGYFINFDVNGSSAASIDSSGRLLVGTSTSHGDGSPLQVVNDTANPIEVFRGQSSTSGPVLLLNKSRGSTASPSIVSDGDQTGSIAFKAYDGSSYVTSSLIRGFVDGTPGANDMPGRLVFSTTADGAASPTERMRITSDGNVGIGTTDVGSYSTYGNKLVIYGTGTNGPGMTIATGTSDTGSIYFADGTTGNQIARGAVQYTHADDALLFQTAATERFRCDSSGRLLVGTSSTSATGTLNLQGNSASSTGAAHFRMNLGGSPGASDALGYMIFGDSSDNPAAYIQANRDGGTWTSGSSHPGRLVFSTTADGASSPTERMRINAAGAVIIGKTSNIFGGTTGYFAAYGGSGNQGFAAQGYQVTVGEINRAGDDGGLISFYQDGTVEGSISVSGTTVSYNGAHLSRWSQILGIDSYDKTVRPEILRGTVMSNLDEMCDWACPTSGECQDNEQLNKTKISDVEGDKNVAGVFQSWDDDDDTWVNDFYLAMTGDFIIRIGAGVTVQRGDLLMSAGDGTAKPQDDDIIRSKTIAKVTSTTVSCTHPDGSYCVPCVLMAC